MRRWAKEPIQWRICSFACLVFPERVLLPKRSMLRTSNTSSSPFRNGCFLELGGNQVSLERGE